MNDYFEGRTKVNNANITESSNLTDTQSLVVLNITLLTSFVSYDKNSNIFTFIKSNKSIQGIITLFPIDNHLCLFLYKS